MDKDGLIQLLKACQKPDTEQVKAATAQLQQNYYNQPVCVLALIDIALRHDDEGLRKLASVQALRLIAKHWEKIPGEQKQEARKHILEAAVKDANKSNLHSNSRLLAATILSDLENGGDDSLLGSVASLCTADDVRSREVGSFVVYSILEENPRPFTDNTRDLLNLLSRNLTDPESKDVRVNAAMSVGSALLIVQEDDESLAMANLIPPIITVLRQCIADDDEPAYTSVFEAITLYLSTDARVMGDHFPQLLHFMMELAANKESPEDARRQALEYLTQCVHFRRMKMLGMKDIGKFLVTNAMAIIAEWDPEEEDDEDEGTSPDYSARLLIDELAGNLSPQVVIVPLLEEFAKYATSPDPALRRAGILTLGMATEGAPDFIANQITTLLPAIARLLRDPDATVRLAALIGLSHMADEMAEDMAKFHDQLITALMENLDAASQAPPTTENKKMIRAACGALDSLCDGVDGEAMKQYGPKLIAPIGRLLAHDDIPVKSSAASAIGSIAQAMGEDFTQYFPDCMKALAPFVLLKEEGPAMSLRSAVCDAMGRIATAVGPVTFQPYVMDLMRASEEAMTLDNDRLQETSFILWGTLSKVYGEAFQEFLPGVFKGLLDMLELEEREISAPANIETSGGQTTLIIGGKKVTLKDTEDDFGDEDDETNWEDFEGAITSTALDQEIAIETLADVICHSCNQATLGQYIQPALEKLKPLAQHDYEGVRKNAITSYMRIFAKVWQIWEESTGNKWQPGLPPKQDPDGIIKGMAQEVVNVMLEPWVGDDERRVVMDISGTFGAMLKTAGPYILTVDKLMEETIANVTALLKKTHPCQADPVPDEEEDEPEESSELDWVVVDTALDVVVGLAAALGGDFLKIWDNFEKPVLRYVSSDVNLQKSTAVGVLAEVIKYTGESITPYTEKLQMMLKRRMTDPDPLTKSNAIYGIGQLIYHSADTNRTMPMYQDLWDQLEPLLQTEEAHMADNTAGCLSRMMMKRPDDRLVAEVLPSVVKVLPLKGDYEENEPIFSCISMLYNKGNTTVRSLTPQLLPVFQRVLSPPEEQLSKDARAVVKQIVLMLYNVDQSMFAQHADLLRLANAA